MQREGGQNMQAAAETPSPIAGSKQQLIVSMVSGEDVLS